MRPYDKNDPDQRWCRRWKSGCDYSTCQCAISPHTSNTGEDGTLTYSDAPYLETMRGDFFCRRSGEINKGVVEGYDMKPSNGRREWEFIINPEDWDYIDERGV